MNESRPNGASVDVHAHLAPLLTEDEAAATEVTEVDGRYRLGGPSPVGPAELYQVEALAGFLDRCRVDEAVVSVPPPFFRQGRTTASTPWARVVNDGLLRRVAGQPRLRALAYLPLEDPAAALTEYTRIRADTRFTGVVAAAGGKSLPLDDAALEPLWSALDDDGRPLLLHPAATPDARMDRHYLSNLLGNPTETAVAAAQLVFGGLLHRYPRVTVILVHCGGAVPAVAGRWQRGLDTRRPGVPELAIGPAAAVRRMFVDTLAHDPRVVDLAAEVFGEDHLLLGSDWPFPMGATDVRAQVAHRGKAAERRIAVENAARALGASSRCRE